MKISWVIHAYSDIWHSTRAEGGGETRADLRYICIRHKKIRGKDAAREPGGEMTNLE